jgi:peptidoglycan/xylan/chitin deacetylase (PgdA/CDA1 family)
MPGPTFVEAAGAVEPLLAARPLIRTVNFHDTPRVRAAEYNLQLERYSRSFTSVDEHDLDQYLTTGCWHKPKPGLIVALYNGYRSNYDVLLPLLKRYRFVGWFFVATAFVDTPAVEQAAFLARHTLKAVTNEYTDGRYALNWSELKDLDRNHIVASHTRHHSKLAAQQPERLEGEIVGPQDDFDLHLGHRVRSFASLSGAAFGEQTEADRWIKAAGYQFVFSNLKIQRLRALTAPLAVKSRP